MTERKFKIAILGKINDVGVRQLAEDGRFDIVERPDHADDRLAVTSDVDGIIVRMTKIDQELVDQAPRLKIVARHGVGYDTVDVDALNGRGIPLALVGDVNSGAVAEQTLALMLALAKKIQFLDQAVRQGRFSERDRFAATELHGRTCLVLGFGRIGRKVAALCRAFGMDVRVYDPFVEAAAISGLGYIPVGDWREILDEVDVVTVHAPKSEGTENLIGAPELNAMKAGSWVINVARGGLVDETALYDALQSGHLGGAGLDVFATEPPEPDNPLFGCENVVFSPHSAAFTRECSARMATACARNIIDYFDNRLDPALVVNPAVLKQEENP